MRERAAAGLHRDYVEVREHGPALRGRLDVTAQLRAGPPDRDRFHTIADDFTADNPFNRLPKSAAESLIASAAVGPQARSALVAALSDFADVASVPLDSCRRFQPAYDGRTEAYRPLLELCRLVADGLGSSGTGTAQSPAFLLDLGRVFENYLTRGLDERLPAGTVRPQATFLYYDAVAGQPALVGRPDIAIARGGKPTAVLDAKWVRLDGPPPADDVHQVLAYAVGLGVADVRLVYPAKRSFAWRCAVGRSGVALTVHGLRVAGPAERCRRALDRLAGEL